MKRTTTIRDAEAAQLGHTEAGPVAQLEQPLHRRAHRHLELRQRDPEPLREHPHGIARSRVPGRHVADVLVVVGGIIPDVDIPKLNVLGITGIFLPGTPMQT